MAKWKEALLHLLAGRIFQYFFWILTTLIIIIVMYLLLNQQASIIELSLLDIRMRLRTEVEDAHTTPSRDIVILGLDSRTDNYIRTHPELGLNLTLPRDQLARVIEYLTQQGVKAIVLDMEFKDAKPGDEALVAAIRRNGHVYAADRMDYDFIAFMRDQPLLADLVSYEGWLRPYAVSQSDLRRRWLPFKSIGLNDLGMGPIYHPYANLAPIVQQLVSSLNRSKLPELLLSQSTRQMRLPEPETTRYGSLEERVYNRLCLFNNYSSTTFAHNSVFLEQLEQKKFNLEFASLLPEEINRRLSKCYTFPTTSPIMDALQGIGISSIDYDEDAFIRSSPVFYKGSQGHFFTYLGLRPVLDLLNIQYAAYRDGLIILNDRVIPMWDGYKILINWRHPKWLVKQVFLESPLARQAGTPFLAHLLKNVDPARNNALLGGGHLYRQLSMIDVLRIAEGKTLSPEELTRLDNLPHYPGSGPFSWKNKIVVVGNTVTDIHRTPMSNTMFGPEVVAAVLDMALHDEVFAQKVSPWLQWALVFGLVVGVVFCLVTFEHFVVGGAVGLILMVLYLLLNQMLFVKYGYLLDVLMPSVTLAIALFAATLYRYYVHDREKHHLTDVFSKYVSPQVMSEIVKNPEKALDNLRGGKKELTVLFSDLHDFTHQFEDADPEVMVSQLNEYFDVMTEIILRYGGTYDKYMGDSIMAFFGAPADLPQHAEMACRAALEMEQALKALNEQWREESLQPLVHGIGISSGEMFVGNFGSKKIKNFTVMGSNVNLGSRLETYTRKAAWPIIISERTWQMIENRLKTRDLGKIQVKGFSDVVQIYGLEM